MVNGFMYIGMMSFPDIEVKCLKCGEMQKFLAGTPDFECQTEGCDSKENIEKKFEDEKKSRQQTLKDIKELEERLVCHRLQCNFLEVSLHTCHRCGGHFKGHPCPTTFNDPCICMGADKDRK